MAASAPQRVGPTPTERAIARVAGPLTAGLMKLPPAVLSPLAGRRPLIDGQRLEPGLALLCRASTPIVNTALERPTKLKRTAIDLFAGTMTHGAPTALQARDLQLGDTVGRLYQPPGTAADAPLLVFFHGGGFIFGRVAGHEGTCSYLADRARIRILSVEYPLAPEHPGPAAHDTAAKAWRWILDNAEQLQIDPARIGIGGDSAGGNLAAYVAYGDHGHPRPRCAFLIYPVTDLHADDPSVHAFPAGLLLTQRGLRAIERHYGGGARHPEAVTTARSRVTPRRRSSAWPAWIRSGIRACGSPSTCAPAARPSSWRVTTTSCTGSRRCSSCPNACARPSARPTRFATCSRRSHSTQRRSESSSRWVAVDGVAPSSASARSQPRNAPIT